MTQAVNQTLSAVEKSCTEIRAALDGIWAEVARTRTRPPYWVFAVEKAHERMSDSIERAKARSIKTNDKAARRASSVKGR